MEGVGVAANIIAIVDLSLKISTLCLQYSKEVTSARADIARLNNQVEHLAGALRATQRLVESPSGASLSVSQALAASFRSCISDLEQAERKLDPSPVRTVMRRYGLRALKWPFKSKEIDQLLASLQRHEKAILLGLQVDQTAILIDIQEGVNRMSLKPTDRSSISRRHHLMVPFTPNPNFVDRPDIETWMQDQYTQPSQRMALVGMGGFGKSKLAIQFAHRVHTDKPDTSVFWVNGGTKAAFEESYRTLADTFALPRRHEPEVNVLELVRDYLQRHDTDPWLLIVDNADDINVFFPVNPNDGVAPYIPKTTRGKVLVTSRSLDAAERLVGSSRAIMRVPVMGEEQALELLQGRLEIKADEGAGRDLVRALDLVPLAIKQAAGYINRRSPRVTPSSYLEEFHRSEKKKDKLLRSDRGDLDRQDGVSNSIIVTWQMTFKRIKEEQPSAARLLSLMSQFQAQNIPEIMLHGYDEDDCTADDQDDRDYEEYQEYENCRDCEDCEYATDDEREGVAFEDDLYVLRGYFLIHVSTEGLFEMHPLVQFCTRQWISECGDPTRWRQLFIKLADEHFPVGEFEVWGVRQSLLPHLEPFLEERPRKSSTVMHWARLLTKVSWHMVQTGEYYQSEILARAAVQASVDTLGHRHKCTEGSKSHLGLVLLEQGRLDEVEKLCAEEVAFAKAEFGLQDLYTLDCLGNYASVLRQQGRLDEAVVIEREQVEERWEIFGLDDPQTLVSLNNLAVTLQLQGLLEEVEILQVEVFERRTTIFGRDHPETMGSASNLAETFRLQGRLEEAETLQVEVLEKRRATLGCDHPDTMSGMYNLALTWRAQSRFNDSRMLMQECAELRQHKLGGIHPGTQNSVAKWQKWQDSDLLQENASRASGS